MTKGAHILVVDDDRLTRTLIRVTLERAGFRVTEAEHGRQGLRLLFQEPVDAVILDVDMPELDGWTTLARIREVSAVPVLMLTGHDSEMEKVRGLRAGADDYVAKPFGKQELLARVEVMVRRTARATDAPADRTEDSFLRVDHDQRTVAAATDGHEIALTPTEFSVLSAFVRNPGTVLSADRLIDLAWDNDHVAPEQVRLYVNRLRRKLADELDEVPIETLRGFGYRYRATA